MSKYSITARQQGSLESLIANLKDVARQAHLIRVSAKSDVDYFRAEFRSEEEKDVYDFVAKLVDRLDADGSKLRALVDGCAAA